MQFIINKGVMLNVLQSRRRGQNMKHVHDPKDYSHAYAWGKSVDPVRECQNQTITLHFWLPVVEALIRCEWRGGWPVTRWRADKPVTVWWYDCLSLYQADDTKFKTHYLIWIFFFSASSPSCHCPTYLPSSPSPLFFLTNKYEMNTTFPYPWHTKRILVSALVVPFGLSSITLNKITSIIISMTTTVVCCDHDDHELMQHTIPVSRRCGSVP